MEETKRERENRKFIYCLIIRVISDNLDNINNFSVFSSLLVMATAAFIASFLRI